MKKIIIVGYELSGFGGTETVCKKCVSLLSKHNADVDISFIFFKENNKFSNDTWLKGIKFKRIFSEIRNPTLRRIHFVLQFSRHIKQENPDLIIAISTRGCYISNLARKISFTKIPIFSWVHLSLYSAYKAIFTLKADYHLSISTGNTNYLINMGVPDNKIHTIFNPISRTPITITRPKNISRFIYVGRIIAKEGKNIQSMFHALSKIKGNWELHVLGSGDDINILQSLAVNLNIEQKISWHGWQENPWDYIVNNIKEVTALLLTSTHEGLPMVLGEANSYGIYCVSSDCKTGPSDIIQNSINGTLYPVDRPDVLVNLLQDIVNGKPLPNSIDIKNAIEKFYDDNYLSRIESALNIY
ncbi:glycosyltransferase [Photorhabdus australis]|uniref:glycosyltransferase n=1 Tax=Photorhabdus australis TaxID=286156 RepID=UPI0005681FA3|nr:glycosyltransferase [Photorhabdus australis]